MSSSDLQVTWLCLEWPREGEHVGGVGRYCQRLAERLRSKVELRVVAEEGAIPMDGVEITRLAAPSSRLDRYYGMAYRARRVVGDLPGDVIHAHGDDWLLRGDRPLVRSFYGSSWGEALSSSGLRRLNHLALAGTEKLSQARADLRIGIAPESESMFRCHVLMPPYFGSGARRQRTPAPEPSVLFIGSHGGRKQGWLAERIVGDLRSDSPDARLIVVGPESDASSWQPWVDHRSGVTDVELSQILADSWLLISPSAYEGFGIPIVEGLAAGLPVVALSNPGSEYLRSRGGPDTPLAVARTEGELADLVRQRFEIGPDLSREQAAGSVQLVREVAEEGSVDRLVSLYRGLVS